MQEILGLVRRCVTDYDMIESGETVAVGVSGGKDSLVTLTALARLSKFYQKPFKVVAITVETGVPGMSFDAVADYCAALGVEYIRVNVPIYEIVFLERKEKNPCSLCAKLRRGALSTAMNEHGIKTIALGHHYDDAVETLLMNLLFEGRIGCFQPVTYLSRSDVTQIRPLLYVKEQQVRNVAAKLDLPIVHNPCPANGETRRQEVKELIESLSERYPDLKQKLFGAMQRYPLYGWDTKNSEKVLEYINNNYSDSTLSIQSLLKKFYISESQLRRDIKRVTGMSPNSYINSLRIEKAKNLLLHYKKSVEETSYLCGFSSQFYFSRRFKEYTGYTPSEYKKNRLG